MFVADHHTPDELHELVQAIPQKRLWRRAQAVVLAKQGRTAQDIADALGCSPKAVKNWVAQYNRGAIEALRERPRSGRPPLLDPQEYPRLKQRLDAPPRPEDGVCTLRGADVRRILEREFGTLMSLQSVYDLLQRLGYSSLMPRPRHEDANPEVQEFFKEIVAEQIDAIAAEYPDKEVRVYFQGDCAILGNLR
jgi:transposase